MKNVIVKIGFIVPEDADPDDIVEVIDDLVNAAGIGYEFIDFEEYDH